MKRVWVKASNIISPLGKNIDENYFAVTHGKSGIKPYLNNEIEILASWIIGRNKDYNSQTTLSIFENMMIESIKIALESSSVKPSDKKTVFIVSSTKGNISALNFDNSMTNLFESAKKVSSYFSNPNNPIVISNACISGSLALLAGKRLIDSGMANHAVICGCDLVSEFVLSGFGSLQAISSEPCRPFDKERKGISLGEAAATMILSSEKDESLVCLSGGSTSNDSNHISGPSRTGEELALAITSALQEAGLGSEKVDFISAHGTATLYNDEMEANAFDLLDLNNTPVNSLKGFYGHTLGAAGIVESAISLQSLQKNELVPTHGFENPGVSKPINVIKETEKKELKNFLKTASGFGGCNAALVFEKN